MCNNDVFCSKLLTVGEKRVILVVTVLYMLDGIPCIYYGDEQRMTGKRDPFCRRTFLKTNSVLHSVCTILGELRRKNMCISDKVRVFSYGNDVLIIVRQTDSGYFVGLINVSDCIRHISDSIISGFARVYDLCNNTEYVSGLCGFYLNGISAYVLFTEDMRCLKDDMVQIN